MALSKVDGTNFIAPTIPVASGGTGAITLAAAGLANTPNFYVTASSDQTSIGDNVATQINFGTEIFDSDSAFASNTFTVPSGEDGKYQFVTGMHILGTNTIYDTDLSYYINDSKNVYSLDQFNSDQGLMYHSALLDLDAGDTVKVYGKVNINAGGTWSVDQDTPASTSRVSWYGYRLIGA